jgi:sarcosine oxidase
MLRPCISGTAGINCREGSSVAQQADVVVVGGGVMGLAAAYELARAGRSVTLLDQHERGHSLGSSHGPTRMTRLAYDGADYVELCRTASRLWRELELASKQSLLNECGGMDLGDRTTLASNGVRDTYLATGVPFEELDRDEIVRRFPQFTPPDDAIALYQPSYGLLSADRCVAAFADLARRHGATLRDGVTVSSVAPDGDGVIVETSEGRILAGRAILAAGSWMKPMLVMLGLDLPVTVLKEQLAFFEVEDLEPFRPGRFPLVIHRFPNTTSIGSAFPATTTSGVKMMIDRIGPVVDPHDADRTIDQGHLEHLRRYATNLLPGLTGVMTETTSCRYTMTPDEDFILDRHPEHPQIVVASPCSGHGFKFAPVIGKILADLAIDGRTSHNIARFRLDRPALTAPRAQA